MSATVHPAADSTAALHDFEIVPLDSSVASLGGERDNHHDDDDDDLLLHDSKYDPLLSRYDPLVKCEPRSQHSDDEDLSSVTSGLPCHPDTDLSDVGEETFVNDDDNDDHDAKVKKEYESFHITSSIDQLKDSAHSQRLAKTGVKTERIDDSVQSDVTLRLPYSMIEEKDNEMKKEEICKEKADVRRVYTYTLSTAAFRRVLLGLQLLLPLVLVLYTAVMFSTPIRKAFFSWFGQSSQALAALEMYELAGPAIMLVGAVQWPWWSKLELVDRDSSTVPFTISRPNANSNEIAMLSWEDVAHTQTGAAVSKRGMKLIVGNDYETRTFVLGQGEKVSPITHWRDRLGEVLNEVKSIAPPVEVANELARRARQIAADGTTQLRRVDQARRDSTASIQNKLAAIYADRQALLDDMRGATNRQKRRLQAAIDSKTRQASRGLDRLARQVERSRKKLNKIKFQLPRFR